jgi:DNA polymerase III subunit gamma/tau
MSDKQVLALQMRPQRLEQLVGQEKLISRIRGHYEQGRMPQAWMFVGQTGSGKTTIARILANAYQCRHQQQFGSPCDQCIRNGYKRDIVEINASDVTGIDDLRNVLQGSNLSPSPGSRKRVFILDEAQRLSKAAQNLLLKYFEDCPESTVFIVCTTEPEKILHTLRRRCMSYTVRSLDMDGIEKLVKRAMKRIKSERTVSELVEALWSTDITSAGLIVNAVEKYAAGATAEEAAQEVTSDFDTTNLNHAIVKGDLEQCMQQLKDAKDEDYRMIRRSVANYLRGIITKETDISDRTTIVANSIFDLIRDTPMEDALQLPHLTAAIYRMCERFARYKH